MRKTYPVFLLWSIVGLTDAYAESVIVNGLVGALSHGLATLVCQISTHLGSHWSQLKLVLTAASVNNLSEIVVCLQMLLLLGSQSACNR